MLCFVCEEIPDPDQHEDGGDHDPDQPPDAVDDGQDGEDDGQDDHQPEAPWYVRFRS